jgi:hypothetical protein
MYLGGPRSPACAGVGFFVVGWLSNPGAGNDAAVCGDDGDPLDAEVPEERGSLAPRAANAVFQRRTAGS